MQGAVRTNPIDPLAITMDDVGEGSIVSYRPVGGSQPARQVTLLSTAYIDDDGDYVFDVRHPDEHESVMLSSTLGLTCNRYTGEWTAIAHCVGE